MPTLLPGTELNLRSLSLLIKCWLHVSLLNLCTALPPAILIMLCVSLLFTYNYSAVYSPVFPIMLCAVPSSSFFPLLLWFRICTSSHLTSIHGIFISRPVSLEVVQPACSWHLALAMAPPIVNPAQYFMHVLWRLLEEITLLAYHPAHALCSFEHLSSKFFKSRTWILSLVSYCSRKDIEWNLCFCCNSYL